MWVIVAVIAGLGLLGGGLGTAGATGCGGGNTAGCGGLNDLIEFIPVILIVGGIVFLVWAFIKILEIFKGK